MQVKTRCFLRGNDRHYPAEKAGQREGNISIEGTNYDVEGRALFALASREGIMLYIFVYFIFSRVIRDNANLPLWRRRCHCH
jgi:hypothetical protein